MANEQKIPTLTQALSVIGNAHVYKGNPFTANTWSALGQKLGPITVNRTQSMLYLRAPEITGPTVHAANMDGEDLSLSFQLIMPPDTASAFFAGISPTGTKSGGYSYQIKPVESGFAVIPDNEIGGGLTYAAAAWTRLASVNGAIAAGTGATVAPVNALWIPRGVISGGSFSYDPDTTKPTVVNVTIQAMFANQAGVPEGAKLYTFGDPSAIYTSFLFSSSTP